MDIHIQAGIERWQIQEFISRWDTCEDVSLEIDLMTPEETRALFALLTPFLPCEFCESVLETLAERSETPLELLEELSDMPTKTNGCMMSICLRDDLSESLKKKCKKSEDEEVREHFQQRQDWLKRNL